MSRSTVGRATIWNLTTKFGDLDILSEPGGIGRFGDFESRCVRVQVRGHMISVAALDDIIRSKETAGRPKDLAALPGLRRLLAERDRGGVDDTGPPPDRP